MSKVCLIIPVSLYFSCTHDECSIARKLAEPTNTTIVTFLDLKGNNHTATVSKSTSSIMILTLSFFAKCIECMLLLNYARETESVHHDFSERLFYRTESTVLKQRTFIQRLGVYIVAFIGYVAIVKVGSQRRK